jgi:hypothetical protein
VRFELAVGSLLCAALLALAAASGGAVPAPRPLRVVQGPRRPGPFALGGQLGLAAAEAEVSCRPAGVAPLAGAHAVSAAGARAGLGGALVRPHAPLAEDRLLTGIWMRHRAGQAQVALTYRTGVAVVLSRLDRGRRWDSAPQAATALGAQAYSGGRSELPAGSGFLRRGCVPRVLDTERQGLDVALVGHLRQHVLEQLAATLGGS